MTKNKKVDGLGQPISVQEHRETLSATVDIESGTTDFLIKRTLIDVGSGEIVSSQTIRETSPTGEVAQEIAETVALSKDHPNPI